MKITKKQVGTSLIALLWVAVLGLFFWVEPIAQDQGYHDFSDAKTYLSIPHARNVLSNIPFILIGIVGLLTLAERGTTSLNRLKSTRRAYFSLFLGSIFVGIGSSYYHLWPNNETLVWDRLPMTIAFMSLFSIIISEFVSERLGRLSYLPLLIIGISSVLYWWFTEHSGAGDLRFYAVIQFLPLLTIPLLLLFFESKFNGVWGYWFLLLTYIAAKVFETYDGQIHSYLQCVSGHSLKHVLPALGLYILLMSYKHRVIKAGLLTQK